jgi:hypothetical protein
MRCAGLLFISTFCVAAPAVAQQGPQRSLADYDIELGGGYVFLYEEGGYTSTVGVFADGGYGVWTFRRWRVQAIAELMASHFDDFDATYTQFAAGARVGALLTPRIRAFGQFQIGVQNDGLENSATGLVTMPGAGLNYAVSTWLDAQAKVDFPFVRYENGTFSQVRTVIGITLPLGNF